MIQSDLQRETALPVEFAASEAPPASAVQPAPAPGARRFELDGLILDEARQRVTLNDAEVRLTAREFSLLLHLLARRGGVVSRGELLAAAWGSSYSGGARTVDIHVSRLRSKLGSVLVLESIRSLGYRLRGVR
jgi:DNA-binding response OmpR family regulator